MLPPAHPLTEILSNYRQLFRQVIGFFTSSRFKGLMPKLPLLVLILAVVYYIISFSTISILAQQNFTTGTHDVGIYDQVIWLLSRFQAPYSTLGGDNLFAFHASFYCVLLAPLFWLWDNINLLYIAQTVFLALAVFPIFFYAQRKLQHSTLALCVGLSYLMFPALQNMNLENFHPEVITLFFLAWAVYFMLTDRRRWFYLFLALALLGKEEVAVAAVFMGLYLLLFKKQRQAGTVALGAGILWYVFCGKILMPLASGWRPFAAQAPLIYSHWFGAYLSNMFNPAYYGASIFKPEVYLYLAQLLAPVMFIPLLSPGLVFLLLPALAINILSGIGYLMSIYYHYNYLATCFIYFGLVEGLAVIINKLNFQEPKNRQRLAVLLGLAVIISAFIGNSAWSKFPLRANIPQLAAAFKYFHSDGVQSKRQAMSLIPPQAQVSASYSLFPHLGHRQKIYMYPNPYLAAFWAYREPLPAAEQSVDFVAVDGGTLSEEQRLVFKYLIASTRYELIFNDGSVYVARHKTSDLLRQNGINYALYEPGPPTMLTDDFARTLKVLQQGKIHCLYFPDSNGEFQNLLGERIPRQTSLALEFWGYLFIPQSGDYRFAVQTAGQVLLEVDGQLISNAVFLGQGVHRWRLKYLNQSARPSLGVTLGEVTKAAAIIPDTHFFAEFDPPLWRKYQAGYQQQKNQNKQYLAKQKNQVVNGNFETVFSTNQPQAWEIEAWQAEGALCTYQADARQKKEGRYSLMIEHRGKADSRWVQEIWVRPNTFYKLAAWIRPVGIERQGEGAMIVIDDLGLRTDPLFGTADWHYVEKVFKTGVQQTKIKVQCRLGYYGAPNAGMAYFDALEIKELPLGYQAL